MRKKSKIDRALYARIFITTLFITAKTWKLFKYPKKGDW